MSLGATALGFVSEMPSGPGVISDALIAELVASLEAPVDTFLLTSRRDAGSIIEQQRRAGVNTLQLCDAVSLDALSQIRGTLPDVSLVQVIHVIDQQSVEEAMAIAPAVDGLLLDSGNPSLPVKELGGTGRTHDWSLSAEIVRSAPVPVYLAGGLKPGNVGEAISAVRPFGVDLCTGVRTDDQLDEQKLRAFMQSVGAAMPSISP